MNERSRIMLLAACAGVPLAEFKSFVRQIQDGDILELMDDYMRLRTIIRDIRETSLDRGWHQVTMELDANDSAKKVVLDLVRSSKYSSNDAVELISNALVNDAGLFPENIPSYTHRAGLHRWIDRILRIVDPNTLLNVSTKVFLSDSDDLSESWRLPKP